MPPPCIDRRRWCRCGVPGSARTLVGGSGRCSGRDFRIVARRRDTGTACESQVAWPHQGLLVADLLPVARKMHLKALPALVVPQDCPGPAVQLHAGLGLQSAPFDAVASFKQGPNGLGTSACALDAISIVLVRLNTRRVVQAARSPAVLRFRLGLDLRLDLGHLGPPRLGGVGRNGGGGGLGLGSTSARSRWRATIIPGFSSESGLGIADPQVARLQRGAARLQLVVDEADLESILPVDVLHDGALLTVKPPARLGLEAQGLHDVADLDGIAHGVPLPVPGAGPALLEEVMHILRDSGRPGRVQGGKCRVARSLLRNRLAPGRHRVRLPRLRGPSGRGRGRRCGRGGARSRRRGSRRCRRGDRCLGLVC
mmetsp:Transcript_93084/g.300889  ORF Transcript_93084/g.300889 Transcript_93084/m.300889 type:complete len:369 (-) Transcript_93084:394-1500(-)